MLDLYHASREDLIRIILQQRDAIVDLERQVTTLAATQAELRHVITHLTAQVGALTAQGGDDDPPTRGTPKGMPCLKPTQPVEREPRPRKRRAQRFARRRMDATERVVHALRACPDCGAPR